MYESFYGLKEKPFDLHPDPEYLYMSQIHENAYTHLEYAIRENKGFVVVTGEIGSGKTTLINFLLTRITQDMEVGLISNTSLSPEQFITVMCEEFEVPLSRSDKDKSKLIARFHEFLLDQFAKAKRVILIIDEAQNLSIETLEEIRLLSNLEAEKHHLMQTILVGQPELKTKLQAKNLEQFAQRVTVHCHLEGLSQQEVKNYIQYRLRVAGANHDDIFREDAIEAVYRYSGGIPRLINILCDAALVFGYADSLTHVDKALIEAVVESRRAGGLFGETRGEEASEISPDATGRSVSALLPAAGPGPGVFEHRFESLEILVKGIETKIDLLTAAMDVRDAVTLELLKMLKESMESRKRLIIGYLKLKRKAGLSLFEPEAAEDRRAGLFSGAGRWLIWSAIVLAGIAAGMALGHYFVKPF